MPELPIWEPFTWENGFREVVVSDIPCNWFQCQENSCDPVHFEWMHENWDARLKGNGDSYAAKHLKLVFEEFDRVAPAVQSALCASRRLRGAGLPGRITPGGASP